MSKYKYVINKVAQSSVKQLLATSTSAMSNTHKTSNKSESDLKKEQEMQLKKEKKEKMMEACKQKTKNVVKKGFKEKEKAINPTPDGEKKDMSQPMLNSYDPTQVEFAWDSWWYKKKFFTVDEKEVLKSPREKTFVMLLPPPNVTGILHIGHTLMTAIQDTIIRYKRMKGFHALWEPGTDHAGIATQSVVEKKVMKEENKTRNDYGREKFLEKIWEWKTSHGSQIMQQFKRLGVSFDLSHEYFTMDEIRSKAVTHAFVDLFDRGILYRAERIVNWCCTLKTAISDLEIEDLELLQPTMLQVPFHKHKHEFGTMITFAYKLKDDPSVKLHIATTRLETMLADVAVAVNSKDDRYKKFIGKELIHPFFPDRKIVVIADDLLVEMDFGTGAVKVTPAHDPNDLECGKRHNLPIINIFDDEGVLNDNAGKFKVFKKVIIYY